MEQSLYSFLQVTVLSLLYWLVKSSSLCMQKVNVLMESKDGQKSRSSTDMIRSSTRLDYWWYSDKLEEPRSFLLHTFLREWESRVPFLYWRKESFTRAQYIANERGGKNSFLEKEHWVNIWAVISSSCKLKEQVAHWSMLQSQPNENNCNSSVHQLLVPLELTTQKHSIL
jgi:hypothetical protein